MPLLSLLGGLLGAGINAWQNYNARQDWQNFEASKMHYNSIGNQMQQWVGAGLNPMTFKGDFQPVTGTPPQPNQVGNLLSSALSQAGSLWQQKQLAKLNYEVQKSQLELERQRLDIAKGDARMRSQLHSWNLKSAEQAFNRGEYAYAMDVLNYNWAFSTYDTRKQLLNDEAAVSSEHARLYKPYMEAYINNMIERNLSLRHSRSIADKRLVLDWDKHYDDMNYKYTALASSDYNKGRDLDLRRDIFNSYSDYRFHYLDFLKTKFEWDKQHGTWKDIQKDIEQLNYGLQRLKVSPKIYH